MQKKLLKCADWVLDKAVLLICILVALMCLYAGYDTYMVYYHASDDTLLQYKPKANDDFAATKQVLSDCVGWLSFEDTPIDYPIMQGEDNDKYLNMDPYGEYSLSGSIFLDSRNASDWSDPYNLTYGHHMDHEAMYGSLDNYLDTDYYAAHRKGTLVTANGTYDVTIFAVIETDASVKEIYQPKGGYDVVSYLAENADIYDQPVSDHIIGMSTCETAESTGRLVVFGALTKSSDETLNLNEER